MRIVTAALTLALLSTPAFAWTPPATDACEATPDEMALVKQTVERWVTPPDFSKQMSTSAGPAVGCGLWRVTITPRGTVTKLELIRGRGNAAYEPMVQQMFKKVIYQRSQAEWVGMLKIVAEEPS